MFKLRLNNKTKSKSYKTPAIHRTPLYRAKAAYKNMLARCLNANGKNPAYKNVKLKMTLEEWLDWSIPQYTKFIQKYPHLTPNVSRFHDKGHYKIGNIEITSQKINRDSMEMVGQAKDGVKRCSTCKQHKNVSAYGKHTASRDGLNHQCRDCFILQRRKWLNKPGVREERNRKRRKSKV